MVTARIDIEQMSTASTRGATSGESSTERVSYNLMYGNIIRIPTLKDEYVHEVVTCDGPLREKTRSFWREMVLDQGVTMIFNICKGHNGLKCRSEEQTLCCDQHVWPTRVNEQMSDCDITVSCESVSQPEAFIKIYNLIVRQFVFDEEFGLREADVIRTAKVSLIVYSQRILYVAQVPLQLT